jgi:hypothetical protein
MDRRPAPKRKRLKNTKENSSLLSFLLPLSILVRDTIYKHIIDDADYSLSVYVCAPIVVEHDSVIDAAGKRYTFPPAFMPSVFQIVLKNNGSRHLEDNEFLIRINKDDSHPEVANSSEVKITDTLLGSKSPLDQYNAELSYNSIRVSAKRMNPGDFIFAEGVASRPVSVDVFSRSVGLTTHQKRGAAECSVWPQKLDDVYVFFSQNSN